MRTVNSFVSKFAILAGLLAGVAPPSLAQDRPATAAAIRAHIDKDRTQVIPVLRAALANKDMDVPDRLWAIAQLAATLDRSLKYEEALAMIRQGQQEASAMPIERVAFTRQAMQIYSNTDKHQLALAEYMKIAPLLPTLSGKSGQLDGRVEAARAWMAGGKVMSALGQLPEAMDLLVRALNVFDASAGGEGGQAESLNHIAHVHYKSGNLEAAVRDAQRAIDIAEKAGLTDQLAGLYMSQAHFMSRQGKVEQQYQALMRARELAQQDDNAFNLAVITTNLSDVALQRGDYRATLRFVEEAIPLVERSGDRESLLVCWVNKGIALNRLGQREGLDLIRKAIAEFTTTPGQQNVAAEVQGVLAEELARNGDFAAAYAAAMDFKKRSDAVRSASDQKRIADSTARYEADKKQRQIEVLEQEQRGQKRIQMLWVLAGALGLLTTVVLLISRVYLKRAYRTVAEMSLADPLTGLRNRRYLASRIEGDLAQGLRQRATQRLQGKAVGQNADIVFIMIDLDHFKAVNDEHGHAAGDAVLRQFSAILMEEVRDSDTVVRWGGEEFLIMARQASSADIHLLAERIRARVAGHRFDIGQGTVLSKSCSIGFATYPFHAPEAAQARWEDVVSLADQCLYAAKASGRDMWVGVVHQAPLQAPPAAPPHAADVRQGLQDGSLQLWHSAGREVRWPGEHAPQRGA
ncbi:GGDEF domain-containing protein [Massilia sp. PAMC28688]|uniref:diguanylate cyclase n=1 Tax=Massilia sp. PAMC28688 TaxID=2861283 RepID=UPI001C63909C|nr:diguanylate cyclase [Massilia sp. PAMC28688]QYF92593.1 GGDEF domain-containing protein [Massilia sp. PAMC28688]